MAAESGRLHSRILFRLPKWDLDYFLFLHSRICCYRDLTGFFAQSPDMIVKRADGNPVLYAPLAVSKATGPALCDQFQPLLIV